MIEATALARNYRTKQATVQAVAGVDLSVAPGEIVGFLGPNGAGKTTTVRMLTTLLTPTAGSAAVAGFDVVRQRAEVRSRIGYVGQSGGPSEQRVGDELVVQARLRGMNKTDAVRRVGELARGYQIDGLLDTPLVRLSGGQRRRFEIAAGVVHRPMVLFLDEPTAALDPQSRANVWDHIRALRDDFGTTVFLTTHYLDEADALCDRVLVIDGGRIVASDTPDALKAEVGGDSVTLHTADVAIVGSVLATLSDVTGIDIAPDTVRFQTDQAARRLPSLLKQLDQAGAVIDAVSSTQPSLEEVFLRITGRSLREPGVPAHLAGLASGAAATAPAQSVEGSIEPAEIGAADPLLDPTSLQSEEIYAS